MECEYCFKRERELCSPMVVDLSPEEAEEFLKQQEAVRAVVKIHLTVCIIVFLSKIVNNKKKYVDRTSTAKMAEGSCQETSRRAGTDSDFLKTLIARPGTVLFFSRGAKRLL